MIIALLFPSIIIAQVSNSMPMEKVATYQSMQDTNSVLSKHMNSIQTLNPKNPIRLDTLTKLQNAFFARIDFNRLGMHPTVVENPDLINNNLPGKRPILLFPFTYRQLLAKAEQKRRKILYQNYLKDGLSNYEMYELWLQQDKILELYKDMLPDNKSPEEKGRTRYYKSIGAYVPSTSVVITNSNN